MKQPALPELMTKSVVMPAVPDDYAGLQSTWLIRVHKVRSGCRNLRFASEGGSGLLIASAMRAVAPWERIARVALRVC